MAVLAYQRALVAFLHGRALSDVEDGATFAFNAPRGTRPTDAIRDIERHLGVLGDVMDAWGVQLVVCRPCTDDGGNIQIAILRTGTPDRPVPLETPQAMAIADEARRYAKPGIAFIVAGPDNVNTPQASRAQINAACHKVGFNSHTFHAFVNDGILVRFLFIPRK